MKNHRRLEEDLISKYRDVFTSTVDSVYEVLGNNAFNRYLPDKECWHRVINNAVFDAEMVAFSYVKIDLNRVDKAVLKASIIALMSNDEFVKTIASSTNTPERVKKRINIFINCLSGCGGEKVDE
jgi:hypothetical protein